MSNLLEKAKELKIEKLPEDFPKEGISEEPEWTPKTFEEALKAYGTPSTIWYTSTDYTSGNNYTTQLTVPAWGTSPIITTIETTNTSNWSI
jgi:hypothetical protein